VVELHLDVAESLARRYRGRGIDPADLTQVACLALVEAVARFDAARGEFLPFAVVTISGCLKRHFRDHGWVIRPPRRVQELQAQLSECRDTLTQEFGRNPTVHELARQLDQPPARIAEATGIGSCFHPTSLDAPPRGAGEAETTIGSMIGADDPAVSQIEWIETLRSACAILPPSHRRLLYLRFFEQRNQDEIADELGVNQMQVSRLLRRILAALHNQLAPEAGDACDGDSTGRAAAASGDADRTPRPPSTGTRPTRPGDHDHRSPRPSGRPRRHRGARPHSESRI
jgi:RNA polymerase sigma-B factor